MNLDIKLHKKDLPDEIEFSDKIAIDCEFTGLNIERILQGIKILEYQSVGSKRNINLVKDYCIPNISNKVERIIISYIDYVNRVVWQKES